MNKNVALLTFLSAIGGFLFGYDTGVVSGAMLLIEEDPRIEANTLWKELIVSATVGAAWLFSLIGGPLCERYGRKPTILMASVVFTLGAVVMGVAEHKWTLLAGRLIVGAGIGLASMSVPIYISEASPPDIRGLLVSSNVLIITFGQFAAACICGAFSTVKPNGWKYMLGLSGIPSLIQLIGFSFMPESPRWLVKKGRLEEASKVLDTIRSSPAEKYQELLEIQNAIRDERDELQGLDGGLVSIVRQVWRSPAVLKAVILGCTLQTFQQIAGINTVMYYSANIISMAGFSDNSQAIWISSGVASVNFLCTIVGLILVERIGRRKLLLFSLAGVMVALAFLAIGFQLSSGAGIPVTVTEDDVPWSKCHDFRNCESCTLTPECGLCYQVSDDDQSVANGSCLLRSNDLQSLSGRCSQQHISPELHFAVGYCPSSYSWLVVLGLCGYLFFFAPGMGPMPWTINSEIYPMWARSFGNSLATSFNWSSNLLVSMTFLSLTEAITKQGAFYLYTGLAFIGLVFFAITLPETKGKSLEEVEQLFQKPFSIQICKENKSNGGANGDDS